MQNNGINHFLHTSIYGKLTVVKLLFFILLSLCIIFNFTPGIALAIGLAFGLLAGNQYNNITKKYTKYLLQVSVVGLGFSMDINEVMKAGESGLLYTAGTIIITLILGILIGKFLSVNKITSYLISTGTAICGGSAIAAVSPVIKANDDQISVSIGTVFILNAIALFIFPPIGHYLDLTAKQFGIWCAIAIHDTSSVVGAAKQYGDEALTIATTVKLARALWIVPLVFVSSFIFKSEKKKIHFPLFIIFFILASIMRSYIPAVEHNSKELLVIAKAGLSITLFFIGAGISLKSIKEIGFRPLIQGVLLWAFIIVVSLWVVKNMI